MPWLAAVLFGFVIYFDFSGYSDIAIGLARLFNVRFPRILRLLTRHAILRISGDVGTSRCHASCATISIFRWVEIGPAGSAASANVMITMLLGGLWHGAGWNFIIWGGLHQLYLVAFRVWVAQ